MRAISFLPIRLIAGVSLLYLILRIQPSTPSKQAQALKRHHEEARHLGLEDILTRYGWDKNPSTLTAKWHAEVYSKNFNEIAEEYPLENLHTIGLIPSSEMDYLKKLLKM
ncbi:MAG: hypothetical protein HYZ48_01380, partial [Chlamydiales bacterium]|nr:hypothetical protein [Chlamydiales bacterium]